MQVFVVKNSLPVPFGFFLLKKVTTKTEKSVFRAVKTVTVRLWGWIVTSGLQGKKMYALWKRKQTLPKISVLGESKQTVKLHDLVHCHLLYLMYRIKISTENIDYIPHFLPSFQKLLCFFSFLSRIFTTLPQGCTCSIGIPEDAEGWLHVSLL